jgi:hypothetical protein
VTNFRVFPDGDDMNRSDFTNLRAHSDICDQRRRASNDAAIPISVAAINQQTIPKPITIITTATRRPPTPHASLLGISQGSGRSCGTEREGVRFKASARCGAPRHRRSSTSALVAG